MNNARPKFMVYDTAYEEYVAYILEEPGMAEKVVEYLNFDEAGRRYELHDMSLDANKMAFFRLLCLGHLDFLMVNGHNLGYYHTQIGTHALLKLMRFWE